MLRACLAMAAPDDAKRTGGLRVCNGAAATFRDGRLRLPASVFAEYSKPRPWSTPRRGRHRSERTSFMNRAVKGMLCRIFEATAAEHPLPGMASVSTHRFYEQSGQRYALPDIQSRGRGASPGASIGLNGTGFMNRAVGACFAGYSKPWPRSTPCRGRHRSQRIGFMNKRSRTCFAGYSKPWPWSTPRRWRHRPGRPRSTDGGRM